METYAYELKIRGKPGSGVDVKGSHFILADHVGGRDFPRDAVPIQFADVGPWLTENFAGLIGQVAAAEAARDVALADQAAAEIDRDQKVSAAEAATAAADGRAAALQVQIDALTAPPAYITISDRQFFQALALNDLITQEEAEAAVATGTIPAAMAALVDQLPLEQQFPARMLLKGETTFRSDHPLTTVLAGLYNWTPEQMVSLFDAAARL